MFSEEEEIYTPNLNLWRFKKENKVLINPPSNTLHLSNLKSKSCDK